MVQYIVAIQQLWTMLAISKAAAYVVNAAYHNVKEPEAGMMTW